MNMSSVRYWRRLALAAAVSGAVHAAAIGLARFDVPDAPSKLPLAVRILSAPAAVVPEPAPRPSPRPRRAARAAGPALPVVPGPSPIVVPPEAEALETAAADAPPVPEAATDTPAEPLVVATAPPSTHAPEPPLVRSLPRKGRITYNLVYGRDQFPVGRTVQTWEMDGKSYSLASRSETTGILDLLRSQHRTYLSRGTLTPEGLRPETFLMSRNRGRGTEEARAKFDWESGSVTLGPASGQREQSLPPRAQDLVSFMYQLSLDPPRSGRLQLPITNGSRLETYVLEVLPEETIETPLGALRALPIKQVRKAGEESLELWLATEYRYLPVRIRFFSREGEPQGEQIVSEIRLSEE